jgi:hypothetical protein
MVQLVVRIQPTLLPWRPQGQIWPPWHSSHLLAECEGKILGLHFLSQSTCHFSQMKYLGNEKKNLSII